jgi:hypothetical protein
MMKNIWEGYVMDANTKELLAVSARKYATENEAWTAASYMRGAMYEKDATQQLLIGAGGGEPNYISDEEYYSDQYGYDLEAEGHNEGDF